MEMKRSVEPVEPGPGQESVWDYPRPPLLVEDTRRVRVVLGGETIVDTRRAHRVLETSHPPTWYLSPADFVEGALVALPGRGSVCEWKGAAAYFDLVGGGQRAARAAWAYPRPPEPFRAIAGHIALYPARVDACYVDDDEVEPQPGGFYGGWITPDVVGPFKGAPGTMFW